MMNRTRGSLAAPPPQLLLLLLAVATLSPRAGAQSPTPSAAAPTVTATSPSSAPHNATGAASPSAAPLPPPLWGRWRVERRAARQAARQSAFGGGEATSPGGANPSPGHPGPALQHFLERLPPAERESFQRNLQRWRQLTPQEREALRGQAGQLRAQMLEGAERALQESGLKLNNDSREMFLLRYSQERRKLERELREKAEAERARRLPAINEALKREFSAQGGGGSTPAAGSATSPAR